MKNGRQSPSLLSGSLEISEIIRVFVGNETTRTLKALKGLLHSLAALFKRFVARLATEVFKMCEDFFFRSFCCCFSSNHGCTLHVIND